MTIVSHMKKLFQKPLYWFDLLAGAAGKLLLLHFALDRVARDGFVGTAAATFASYVTTGVAVGLIALIGVAFHVYALKRTDSNRKFDASTVASCIFPLGLGAICLIGSLSGMYFGDTPFNPSGFSNFAAELLYSSETDNPTFIIDFWQTIFLIAVMMSTEFMHQKRRESDEAATKEKINAAYANSSTP